MPFKNAPRLETFNYIGLYRYFLTICVANRQRLFTEPDRVDMVLSQLRQCSIAREFSVTAYCFMPDHLHLLVEGLSDESDLRNYIRVFKQQSSFVWRHAHEQPLWQRGYFDRVLREEEDSVGVARYILNNPIRAGIVDAPEKYPFHGSLTMEFGDLIESIRRT